MTPIHQTYRALAEELAQTFPRERLLQDSLSRLAHGTDASFYRLIPQLVVQVESAEEVIALLKACARRKTPVTFRAAGTSLSGQAVSDSVLAVLGWNWRGAWVEAEGEIIHLQPGVRGAEANRLLAPYQRKIGPDPASINAAKIGGIAANNASGMCCGTAQNSYKTLAGVKLILADGTVVDTREAASVAAFRRNRPLVLTGIERIAREAREDEELAARIRHKFKIKNTTGYSLNALIDFDDPVDILAHLMIGSEGTLGFIAEIAYRTVPDPPHMATALIGFPTIDAACRAVIALKPKPVTAVELIDRAGLSAVAGQEGVPEWTDDLPPDAAALLVEVRGTDEANLRANLEKVGGVLGPEAEFTAEPAECARLWNVRKGLFPTVGAVREGGTTVIIEDVAFPLERLAEATADLQRLFQEHGYDKAIIFGHALEGNLHFVFTQDFSTSEEIARYGRFMDAVCHLTVEKYDGSLKAEHGTGRNMAPYVELEWGTQATLLMWKLKALLDPNGLLNPGVILNSNPRAHLKDLKPLPAADPLVDMCIECGFCEHQCPSKALTLTPRQRIAGWRERARLAAAGRDEETASWETAFLYPGLETCAACGLCATACPVGIETGALIKSLRASRRTPFEKTVGSLVHHNFGLMTKSARLGLSLLPRGSFDLPRAGRSPRAGIGDGQEVVYFSSCGARTLGPDADDPTDSRPLAEIVSSLLGKAGYRVRVVPGGDGLCCGLPFESKGLFDTADSASRKLALALERASEAGRLPVIFDTSPCVLRMRRFGGDGGPLVLDLVEFLHDRVLARLNLSRRISSVSVHVTCSLRRMGLSDKLLALASACADEVVSPASVTCCGFAGDRGFAVPELNASALSSLRDELGGAVEGVSSSRTCEMGLARHGGIPYRSIASLLDRCSS